MTSYLNDLRCIVCRHEYSSGWAMERNKNVYCPKCGNNVLNPLKTEDDGYININWVELHMIMTFTSRFLRNIYPIQKADANYINTVIAIKQLYLSLKKYKPPNAIELLEKDDDVNNFIILQENKLEGQDLPIESDSSGNIKSPFYQPK